MNSQALRTQSKEWNPFHQHELFKNFQEIQHLLPILWHFSGSIINKKSFNRLQENHNTGLLISVHRREHFPHWRFSQDFPVIWISRIFLGINNRIHSRAIGDVVLERMFRQKNHFLVEMSTKDVSLHVQTTISIQ